MTIPIIFTAFVLSLGFSFLVLKFFPRFGFVDKPELYGHKRKAIPYPGGVAIYFAFLIAAVQFLPIDRTLISVLVGASLLTITSFIDDRRGLSPILRLIIQFLAAVLLILGGIGILSISNPFGDTISLDLIKIPISLGDLSFTITLLADLLTIIWVVVMVNAFNWIDGVPGMASSVAAVAALTLLLLSVRPDFHYLDQTLSITLSSIVLGASLGFLFFDFPPPKMLMGDSGSMLLGFLLAVVAIISGGKIATTLLVLGFPILDFIWVIGRRVLKGKSPFRGDLWHFHHRLMKAGYSKRTVVVFFAATSMIFGSLALMLATEGKAVAFAGIFAVMILLATLLYSKS